MRAILFHNPTAGGGKFTKKELMTALRLGGLTPYYCSTKGRRFKKTLHQPADLVVVAGGDGTVTKVIAQMPDLRIPGRDPAARQRQQYRALLWRRRRAL
jgi:diacylglycerol kinase (ATP)